MELNILTRQTGSEAKQPYDISLMDFWRVYMRLLLTIGQKINQREEDVIAYILSMPQTEIDEDGNEVNIDYFSAPHSGKMMEALRLARSEVTRLKISLLSKQIIDDKNRPVPALANLQKYVLQNKNVTFIFPFNIQ